MPVFNNEYGHGVPEQQPENSVYYHPTLNPSGVPPPGKPQRYRTDPTSGPRVPLPVPAAPPLPAGPAPGERRMSDCCPHWKFLTIQCAQAFRRSQAPLLFHGSLLKARVLVYQLQSTGVQAQQAPISHCTQPSSVGAALQAGQHPLAHLQRRCRRRQGPRQGSSPRQLEHRLGCCRPLQGRLLAWPMASPFTCIAMLWFTVLAACSVRPSDILGKCTSSTALLAGLRSLSHMSSSLKGSQ